MSSTPDLPQDRWLVDADGLEVEFVRASEKSEALVTLAEEAHGRAKSRRETEADSPSARTPADRTP